MAKGDIQVLYDGGHADLQSRRFKVNTGVAASINAGELVLTALGNQGSATAAGKGSYVTKWGASLATKPSLGTDFVAGVSVNASNETTTASGTVDVIIPLPGMVFLANPSTAATWNTQAKYDLLVGARVLLNTDASGVQTILAADNGGNSYFGGTSGGNGLVVEPLDIAKHPGKVAFSIKNRVTYFN